MKEYLYSNTIYPNLQLSDILLKFIEIDKKIIYKPNLIIFPDEEEKISSISLEKQYTSISCETTQFDSRLSVDNKKSFYSFSCRNSLNNQFYYSFNLTRNNCREGTKKESEIIKLIDYNYTEEDLSFKCEICDKTIKPMLKFSINSPYPFCFEINIFSPLKLFYSCLDLMTFWIKNNYNTKELDMLILRKIMINILFYEKTILIENKMTLIKELFWDKILDNNKMN